jgi:2'-5' RNA ligase
LRFVRMPRAFVAVLIPDHLRARVFDFETRLRADLGDSQGRAVKWVERENLHVTLKFLGSVPDEKVGPVSSKIESTASRFGPFDLDVAGAGGFPSRRRPTVLWVGTGEGSDRLGELAAAVEEGLSELGFAKEQKRFHGHITIGRIRRGSQPQSIDSALGAWDPGTFGRFTVDSISLMESELRPSGPIYSAIQRFDLKER